MKPAARMQAAIELLDAIIVGARDEGAAADTIIAQYFKDRRYAGSKDRRAVRDLVYAAIRLCGERPDNGRAAMLALVEKNEELASCFDGSAHAPAPIRTGEKSARAQVVPEWLIGRLAALVSTEEEQAALLERAPLDVRVNRLKAEPVEVMAALPDAVPVPGFPDALRLPEGYAVEKTEAWESGLIEVQDAGSQLIVACCKARPEMMVIDLCAGAGGKTLALAADMNAQGRLIAADISRSRLSRLPDRAARAGADNVEILLLNPKREAEMLASFEGKADVVLVDAPCSGTGTWRRNPEARWRLTPERLERLNGEQAHLLDVAGHLVKPGGRLVYAVCSLTDAEGCNQVDSFLARSPGWRAEPIEMAPGRSWGEGRLLTPAHDGTDGFFMATMVKD